MINIPNPVAPGGARRCQGLTGQCTSAADMRVSWREVGRRLRRRGRLCRWCVDNLRRNALVRDVVATPLGRGRHRAVAGD